MDADIAEHAVYLADMSRDADVAAELVDIGHGTEEALKGLDVKGKLVLTSGPCAWCTFNWLINGLVWLLGAFHLIVRDWGLAIVLLVVLVRSLLHPITKKSQVSMMKMGKLGPEMERLKKKYGDDKDELNRRINARVKQMIEAGWLDETRRLLESYTSLSPTAGEATGYRELIQHLRGEISLEDAIEQIKIGTRQLARRQTKWFRRFPNATWIEGNLPLEQKVERVLSLCPRGPG